MTVVLLPTPLAHATAWADHLWDCVRSDQVDPCPICEHLAARLVSAVDRERDDEEEADRDRV